MRKLIIEPNELEFADDTPNVDAQRFGFGHRFSVALFIQLQGFWSLVIVRFRILGKLTNGHVRHELDIVTAKAGDGAAVDLVVELENFGVALLKRE